MTTTLSNESLPTMPAASSTTGDHELVLTRVLDAPRELVWNAWTEREHLMRWCAPHNFTITNCEGETRPGGAWRTCMKSPEGIEHWVGGVYRELVRPERLVFTHLWDGEDGQPGRETVVTVTLAEQGKHTKLTFHQAFFTSATSRDGHEEGWNESFERLNDHLRATRSHALSVRAQGEREIVMTRSFKAPQRLVWEAITRPEHVRRWWGAPTEAMRVCEMDFRVGGAWRYTCEGSDGQEHGFRGEYREIAPIERLVQTFEWEGMPGHVSLETLSLSERDGQTTMTILCRFDSTQDRDGMLGSGMEQGAGESYDRLEELLRELA